MYKKRGVANAPRFYFLHQPSFSKVMSNSIRVMTVS